MKKTISNYVAEVLKDYPDAVNFLLALFHVMHVWDDLIDKDRRATDEEVNSAFSALLLDIPTNPFYRRFIEHLHPLMSVAILDWLAANEMERAADVIDLEASYITRSSYAALILKTIELCRGFGFAASVTADIRRTIHQEGFAAYCEALNNQKGA